MIKTSSQLSSALKEKVKAIGIELDSLRAIVLADQKKILELREELKFSITASSRFVPILGDLIDAAEKRIVSLNKIIWKKEREQEIYGKMCVQTRNMSRKNWLGYWHVALSELTYVPNRRIENLVANMRFTVGTDLNDVEPTIISHTQFADKFFDKKPIK